MYLRFLAYLYLFPPTDLAAALIIRYLTIIIT